MRDAGAASTPNTAAMAGVGSVTVSLIAPFSTSARSTSGAGQFPGQSAGSAASGAPGSGVTEIVSAE